ncbi:MAG: aminotransferase class V-fold PLP-dependent enzyme [Gaiellaceae bacterium]
MLAPSEYEDGVAAGYLDTATYGLPPRRTVAAVVGAAEGWRRRESWLRWEEDGEACRALFARLVGAEARDVALVSAVSVATGLVAASLPTSPGDNIVLCERDFTSTIFPWVGLEGRGVEIRARPLEELAGAVDERTALLAVSLVQSSDGAVADLEALKATGVRLFVDATQAAGGVPVSVARLDYLAAHAYKWLLCPRGLAFLWVKPERLDEIEPWTSGWKAAEHAYDDYYGLPRHLARDARRLDVSIAWIPAAGTRASLELLHELGVERVAEHNLALARTFSERLGQPEPSSPIVQVKVKGAEAAVERLRAAGVACSERAGSIRFCFHLYNDESDVELALSALTPAMVFNSES